MISFWLVMITAMQPSPTFRLLETFTSNKDCVQFIKDNPPPEELKNRVMCIPVLNYIPKEA